jgi:hypothetical protein
MMTQKDLFERLNAPLANARWSWGSVRDDGTVFLRVWQDEIKKLGGVLHVRVACQLEEDDEGGSLGYQERLKHLKHVWRGAPCYLVMCQAEDTEAYPRKVKEFNTDNVFRGGKLVVIEGDSWVELGPAVPVREAAILVLRG